MLLSRGSGGCSHGQHRVLPKYHIHHHDGVGTEDGWDPEISLPLTGTKICHVTKNVVSANLGTFKWFGYGKSASVLFCAIWGLVTIKAAVLTFSSHIVFMCVHMGSQPKKKSRSVIYRAVQLPQLGREVGAWPTGPELGSSTLLVRIS